MKKLLTLLVIASTLLSCGDDESNDPSESTLMLDISGLSNLGTEAQYEGWLIVDGSPITTGTFTVDDNGTLSQTSFDVDTDQLENASKFVLTIEPIPDPDASPADAHILAGNFSGNSATLSIMDEAAIGTGFTGASGSYILATPTTTSSDDELSGVWFLVPGMPMQPGLVNLPDLSNVPGWTYEGWAVINGTPVSTGTFDAASGTDNNAPFSGTEGGPEFPGEDFITNAPSGLSFPTNLQGATIVVSVEPVPDNSESPFLLKPLSGQVPSNAEAVTTYNLENIAAGTYPSGTVLR